MKRRPMLARSEGRRLLVAALAHWTQRALARRLGVSHGLVGMWASGERVPVMYADRYALERLLGIAMPLWDEPAQVLTRLGSAGLRVEPETDARPRAEPEERNDDADRFQDARTVRHNEGGSRAGAPVAPGSGEHAPRLG